MTLYRSPLFKELVKIPDIDIRLMTVSIESWLVALAWELFFSSGIKAEKKQNNDKHSYLNIPIQTFLSQHSYPNISIQTFLSKHSSYPNISIQTFLSKHSYPNISIRTFLSKHFYTNIPIQTFPSKHSYPNNPIQLILKIFNLFNKTWVRTFSW